LGGLRCLLRGRGISSCESCESGPNEEGSEFVSFRFASAMHLSRLISHVFFHPHLYRTASTSTSTHPYIFIFAFVSYILISYHTYRTPHSLTFSQSRNLTHTSHPHFLHTHTHTSTHSHTTGIHDQRRYDRHDHEKTRYDHVHSVPYVVI
jgi:hypothetical protein